MTPDFYSKSDFHLPPAKCHGPERRFLAQRGLHAPDCILVEVTEHKGKELPQWWGADDVVKKFGSTPAFESFKIFNYRKNIVAASTLHDTNSVFMDMAIPHRLKIQELPALAQLGK
jgi:hypothetical protein